MSAAIQNVRYVLKLHRENAAESRESPLDSHRHGIERTSPNVAKPFNLPGGSTSRSQLSYRIRCRCG